MQQAKLEGGVCLLWLLLVFDSDIKQVLQMFYSLRNVALFGMRLGKLLMRLSFLLLLAVLLRDLQELIQKDNRFIQIALLLMDETYLLVTLGLHVLVC